MRISPFAAAMSMCLTLALGCSSDEPKKASPPPGGFAPDEPKTGAIVLLRGRTASGKTVVMDVVARGAQRGIHGAAFRLHWDPAKLGFDAARGSDAWSRDALFLAKEGAPGELVVVWTEKGARPAVNATDETILGSLDFTVKTSDDAALEFRPDRSTLRDESGASLAVEWQGGRIAGR
jgi:hypothetical protein